MKVHFIDMPDSVRADVESHGLTLFPVPATDRPDAVHVFATERASPDTALRTLRYQIAQTGFVWVSWPKKASKVPTDITEDTIRQIALPLGLVDVKVCAIDAVWSGLKLMIRKELRTNDG